MINKGLLYPERKRCAKCRRYFGPIVISGLWCSRKCAGAAEISADPKDWPREHFSWGGHGRVPRAKTDFQLPTVARREAKRYGKEAYQCGYCLGWHIGSPAPGKTYDATVVMSR